MQGQNVPISPLRAGKVHACESLFYLKSLGIATVSVAPEHKLTCANRRLEGIGCRLNFLVAGTRDHDLLLATERGRLRGGAGARFELGEGSWAQRTRADQG